MAFNRRPALLLALALVAGALAAPASGAEAAPAFPGCASNPDHPGGDWRHYGSSYANTRNQPAEKVISPANVANLAIDWSYSLADDDTGTMYSTPIIHRGCMILTTSTGYVVVRNADTGALVWKTATPLDGNSASLIGGFTTGSVAVSDDFWIYVGVGKDNKPHTTAFRPTSLGTWEEAWRTTVDTTPNSFLVAGPVLYEVPAADPGAPPRRLVFQGFMGKESTATARGGYAILDALTGERIAHGYTIDDASYAAGFRGASIWGQSTLDPESLYVYSPTGNPASKQREHRYSNAVVKIDVDPRRATFGQIVGHYKGNPDNYVDAVDIYSNPVCQSPLGNVGVIWGQVCLQLDLDFGAAPNLFRGANGKLLVGAFQKSGVYHVFDAATMQRVFTSVVGLPGFAINAASPAVDRGSVFINAQPPGQLVSISQQTGTIEWAQPMGDGTSFVPVSTANGVVYGIDKAGLLRAIDADSGLLLKTWSMSQEFGKPTTGGESAGIAIARNTVYVAIPDYVIAYRLPGAGTGPLSTVVGG